MGQRIVKQPNGRYGIFSTVVDTFTVYDATLDELIEHLRNEAAEAAERDARGSVARAETEPTRFDDCLGTVEVVHGRREAQRLRDVLSRK